MSWTTDAALRWIESAGGPLVLMPEHARAQWRGITGGAVVGKTDYQRACEVTDTLGVVDVGDTKAIVLADEPLPTLCVLTARGGLLVRWVYAESEAAVVDFLHRNQLVEFAECGDIDIPGTCILFDAAEPGNDIKGDSQMIPLEPGSYAIRSATVSPSPDLRLLLHELSKP